MTDPEYRKLTIIEEGGPEKVVTTFHTVTRISYNTVVEEPLMVNGRHIYLRPPEVEEMSVVFKPLRDDNGLLYTSSVVTDKLDYLPEYSIISAKLTGKPPTTNFVLINSSWVELNYHCVDCVNHWTPLMANEEFTDIKILARGEG